MNGRFRRFLLICLLLAMASCSNQSSIPERSPDFAGSFADLKSTELAATLDTPISEGKSVIWCASFQASWKALETNIAGGPILLDGSPQLAQALNASFDPRPSIPADCLYVFTGFVQTRGLEQISRDLRERFPQKSRPQFPGITPNSFVAYSYLEATVPFGLPYRQNPEPLLFKSSDDRQTVVKSFGFSRKDDGAYRKVRAQARVLFREGDGSADSNREFAIDLCAESSPSQIVLARISRQRTLAETMTLVEQKAAKMEKEIRARGSSYDKYLQSIGQHDVLTVPELCWSISHRFSSLEGRGFANPALKQQRLDVAQQDIFFRLDKSGAKLASESKMHTSSQARDLVFDRPFLIYMKKRGAGSPYFVMWVDNAELLSPWNGRATAGAP